MESKSKQLQADISESSEPETDGFTHAPAELCPPSMTREQSLPQEEGQVNDASDESSPSPSRIPPQHEEVFISSSSLSSSADSFSDSRTASDGDPGVPMSFQRTSGRAPSSAASAVPEAAPPVTAPVPTDQERQLLLLMLLGQVCALHDPTPRTFTAHVLEFFERGILDRQSIHFLYRLGLVPSYQPIKEGGGDSKEGSGEAARADPPAYVQQDHPLLLLPAPMAETAVVAIKPDRPTAPRHDPQRTAEVSAIRSTLERQELQRQVRIQQMQQRRFERWSRSHLTTQSAPLPPSHLPVLPPPPHRSFSFAAENHPLSFSRFQREFRCARVVNAGAFGVVYHATSKMDGIDYAVKVVEFTASGFDGESVQRVVREVKCLAMCDHANVVRYYTSWLEPSWMTGSSAADVAPRLTEGSSSAEYGSSFPEERSKSESPPKTRHHLHRLLRTESPVDLDGLSDDLQSLFLGPAADDVTNNFHSTSSLPSARHVRRHSWGEDQTESKQSVFVDEGSEWSGWERSKDDLFLGSRRLSPRSNRRWLRSHAEKIDHVPSIAGNDYQYQICLFIQMQLCTSITLADWIRDRNDASGENQRTTPDSRLDDASQVFLQLAQGLAHVHHKGIIHRDLKPSNVFVCHEPHGINFKIGDFGLSKLIRTTFPDSPQGSAQRVVFEEYDERGGHFVVQPSEAALVDAPLISKDRHFPVREPLTAGVGTASYAAPEQATSKVYGSSADIFSLGLILLELICSFSTEHERLQVFGDCRHKRKVPDEVAQFPLAARTILSCTEPDPAKRPTALELSTLNFRHETTEAPTSRDAQVETLTQQLAAKELEVEHYKLQLQDRQRTIESLERELRRLTNGSPASIFTYPKPLVARAPNTESCTLEVSSSSSSDEDR